MTASTAKKMHQKASAQSSVDVADQKRGEEAVNALQIAQNNLINDLAEQNHATPAHQTLGNLIAKDILIVLSILFWPAVIYWLW